MGSIMAKQTTVAHFVTEAEAEAVLSEVRPWPRREPGIDRFREQLDATVEAVWAIHTVMGHYRAVGEALRSLRRFAQRAKIKLRAMEGSSALKQMVNYTGLLKLDDVSAALVAAGKMERALSLIPPALSGRGKPGKGVQPRAWYSGFIRDLAEIANEHGIEVNTAGDRSRDPYDTPFTRFVFAVEKLRPLKEQSRRSAKSGFLRRRRSAPLAACAKRIDRAIAASAHEIGEVIPRKGKT
jgi:hypothetical protein